MLFIHSLTPYINYTETLLCTIVLDTVISNCLKTRQERSKSTISGQLRTGGNGDMSQV